MEFEYLVDQGVDIENKSRKTVKNCFHTACEKGHVQICEYILKKKNELLKELDKNEQHVGHFVAKSGNTSIMKLLLKHVEKNCSYRKLLRIISTFFTSLGDMPDLTCVLK